MRLVFEINTVIMSPFFGARNKAHRRQRWWHGTLMSVERDISSVFFVCRAWRQSLTHYARRRSNFNLQSLTLSNYGFWSSIFFIVQQRQVEKKIAINSEIMKIVCQLFRMIKVWGHWLHLSLSHYNGPSDGYPDTHLLIEAKLRQWWSKCSARWWVWTPRPHTPGMEWKDKHQVQDRKYCSVPLSLIRRADECLYSIRS